MRHIALISVLTLVAAGALAAPKPQPAAPQPAAPIQYASDLIARGQKVYRSQCIACHNVDPRKPGSQGPDVFGSSRVLLEARVLTLNYPPGYTPKRMTKNMRALPYLKNDIPALEAFLNTPLP